jgi:hypothetical protein
MLKSIQIARIQFERALKIAQGFLVFSLAVLDEGFQLKDPRIVRQRSTGYVELSKSTIIVEAAAKEIFAARKVCFACVGIRRSRPN